MAAAFPPFNSVFKQLIPYGRGALGSCLEPRDLSCLAWTSKSAADFVLLHLKQAFKEAEFRKVISDNREVIAEVLRNPESDGAEINPKFQILRFQDQNLISSVEHVKGGAKTVFLSSSFPEGHLLACAYIPDSLDLTREKLCLLKLQKSPSVQMQTFVGGGRISRFMVSNWAIGGDLQQYIMNYVLTPLSNLQIYGMMIEIATAYGDLHKNGVIHVDVKPSNILVFANGLKITDFGCSTIEDTDWASLGTPSFLPPEAILLKLHEALADPEAPKSPLILKPSFDAWGVGILFYALCTRCDPPWRSSINCLFDSKASVDQKKLAKAEIEKLKDKAHLASLLASLSSSPFFALIQQLFSYSPDERPTMARVGYELRKLRPRLT